VARSLDRPVDSVSHSIDHAHIGRGLQSCVLGTETIGEKAWWEGALSLFEGRGGHVRTWGCLFAGMCQDGFNGFSFFPLIYMADN
jgi:hypothetical protein